MITADERKALIKEIGFAIALCSSPKPELKAEVALAAVEKKYDIGTKGHAINCTWHTDRTKCICKNGGWV